MDEINFDPHSADTVTTDSLVTSITEKAEQEGASFQEKLDALEMDDNTSLFTEVMKKTPTSYSIIEGYQNYVAEISLPQFFKKVDANSADSLFEELNLSEQKLHKNILLEGFNLLSYDTALTFEEISAEVYQVDYSETKGVVTASKINKRAKDILIETILAKPQESQISQLSGLIVSKLGDMAPISDQDLKKYVTRVFDNLTAEHIRDIINNDFIYVKRIKDKIKQLSNDYAKNKFRVLIDSNEIIVKPNFTFPDKITPLNLSTSITKSLYQREGSFNSFEQKIIFEIAALDNIIFWHRNLGRGRGFALNGFNRDHYPDFILYTTNHNIILLETKGDYLDNDETTAKNLLGKTWAEKAGSKYKYFMVFEKKKVENTYTADTIIDVIKRL